MSRRDKPWDINNRHCDCGNRIERDNLSDYCNACLERFSEAREAKEQWIEQLQAVLHSFLTNANDHSPAFAAREAAQALWPLFNKDE